MDARTVAQLGAVYRPGDPRYRSISARIQTPSGNGLSRLLRPDALGTREYNPTRLESACRRALALRAPTYRSVASILKAGLDQQPLPTSIQTELHLPAHPNVRGSKYYH